MSDDDVKYIGESSRDGNRPVNEGVVSQVRVSVQVSSRTTTTTTTTTRRRRERDYLTEDMRGLSVQPVTSSSSRSGHLGDRVPRCDSKRQRTADDGIVPIDAPPRMPDGPVVTEATGQIWSGMMRHHPLDVLPPAKADLPVVVEKDAEPDGKIKPLSKRQQKSDWVLGDLGEERPWDGLRLDGATYWVNDGVVAGGKHEEHRGIIRRIVERRCSLRSRSTYSIHVHWLKELGVGASNELFLEDRRCDDVPASHIQRSLDIQLLRPGEKARDGSRFFSRLVAEADHRLRDPLPPNQCRDGCDSCTRKAIFEPTPMISSRRGCLCIHGDELHIGDAIMIDPGVSGQAFVVGRISSLSLGVDKSIQVEVYDRHEVAEFKDERRLVRTNRIENFALNRVLGRCGVVSKPTDITRYEPYPMFWCGKGDLTGCVACTSRRVNILKSNRAFAKLNRLSFADYYSGAGGGVLSANSYFDVVAAVEMDEVACRTLRRNHPHTMVCQGKVEDLHHREIQRARGDLFLELYEPGDAHRPASRRTVVPSLPAPGTITGLMGGVPCQPHSRINMFKKADDDRNHQLGYFMSEIDRVRPAFVVLENVPGFKDSRNDDTFVADGPSSYAQAAMSMLVQADYQCQLAILDARAYGSPQNRARLWIMAARRGIPLPKMPLPTHANPLAKSTRFSLERQGWGETVTYVESGTVGTGPFPSITVEDAIADLPPFEYEQPDYPHRTSVPQLQPHTTTSGDVRVGYVQPVAYHRPALTSYQHAMRQGQATVRDHYTPRRTELQALQCHRALNEHNLPGPLQALDKRQGFATLLTSNAPDKKATRPIHYDQARTKTIAEDKRAMGFPDAYALSGTAEQQVAQLGNAWVVPMGEAIVREIRDVIREAWVSDQRPQDLRTWWLQKVKRDCRDSD